MVVITNTNTTFPNIGKLKTLIIVNMPLKMTLVLDNLITMNDGFKSFILDRSVCMCYTRLYAKKPFFAKYS